MPSNAEIVDHSDFTPSDVQIISVRVQKPIKLVEADPKWATTFALLEQQIRAAVGSQILAVNHVGSTSVPNLPAKDCIDIDLIVADPSDEASYVQGLESVGFQFLLREPSWNEHRFFGLAEPYANLHVFGPDSPEPVRHQIFSQWLRENEDDRLAYEKMKREAAAAAEESHGTIHEYTERKGPLIRDILDRAFKAQGLLDP